MLRHRPFVPLMNFTRDGIRIHLLPKKNTRRCFDETSFSHFWHLLVIDDINMTALPSKHISLFFAPNMQYASISSHSLSHLHRLMPYYAQKQHFLYYYYYFLRFSKKTLKQYFKAVRISIFLGIVNEFLFLFILLPKIVNNPLNQYEKLHM